jgi:hypothetical protein
MFGGREPSREGWEAGEGVEGGSRASRRAGKGGGGLRPADNDIWGNEELSTASRGEGGTGGGRGGGGRERQRDGGRWRGKC